MSDQERVQHLLMKKIDGELEENERAELQQLLDEHPELADELEQLEQVKEVTDMMSLQKVPAEVWDQYWHGVYNRVERGIGWVLVSVGTVIILAWGTWEILDALWHDADAPLVIKLSVFGVLVGLLILTVSVVREKLAVRKHDPFKEVQR